MSGERTLYLVIGHNTPTDAGPEDVVGEQGKLDEGVSVLVVATRAAANSALLWYQDGLIREIRV